MNEKSLALGNVGRKLLMTVGIQKFFECLAARLFAGELDWLEDVYVYPMSLFIEDRIHIENGPEETAAYLRMRREHAAQVGVYAMTAQVLDVEQVKGSSRFSAHVQYIFLSNDGTELGRNTSLYRCHFAPNGAIRVESLEILEVGLPFPVDTPVALRH